MDVNIAYIATIKTNIKPVCCICFKTYDDWGNNALPVISGRCCMNCNITKVIPERIRQFKEDKMPQGIGVHQE